MSWTFQLHNINQSFDRIAAWYKEFMHRTEMCFRTLNERILRLEERHATQGPSDEQVERVLRKILAERFGDSARGQLIDSGWQEQDYFVEPRGKHAIPKPILIDPMKLMVDPEAVPSTAYVETFQMLEHQLATFPRMRSSQSEDEDLDYDVKTGLQVTPKSMDGP